MLPEQQAVQRLTETLHQRIRICNLLITVLVTTALLDLVCAAIMLTLAVRYA